MLQHVSLSFIFHAPPSVNQVYKELDQMSQSDFGVTPLCNTVDTLLDVSNLLGGSQQSTVVGNLLRNQSQFQQFLEREYNVRPELAQELLRARVNVNAVSGAGLVCVTAKVITMNFCCMAVLLLSHSIQPLC